METLSPQEVDQFWSDGYLMLDAAISPEQLMGLRRDFETWVNCSRTESEAYGSTHDGRARFDLEPGHDPEHPALRRVASPIEISDVYLDVMHHNRALDAIVDILGPNIRFNNSKINSKQPGAATTVKYHQDFLFEPHTNHDLITVLFFLDDVSQDNGPLEVVPGSHTDVLHEHWHGGQYTGAVSQDVASRAKQRATTLTGAAGSACLMHTLVLHGSGPNLTAGPRTVFICEYCAEDAHPLQANHLPSRYMHDVVRGSDTGRVRCASYEMAFPEIPTGASFFVQQALNEST